MIESNTGLPCAVSSAAGDTPQRSSPTDDQQSNYVSKMHMHSQETSEDTIAQERAMILVEADVSASDDIVYDDEGWDSRVFVINGGEVCYKFPRSAEVMASYCKEVTALNMINELGVEMKTQRFKSLDLHEQYFSYYGLVGTQLSELLPIIDTTEKQRIGNKIGLFLKVLHASELDGAPLVTVDDEVLEYVAKYELARPLIEAKFTTKEQTKIAEFFNDHMPHEMRQLGSKISLCHGDLGSYNILIDDEGAPGIIDFGNLGYYDQSKDFIDFGDDDVLESVYEAYGDDKLLRAKTKVRMIALPAIDLVYYMGKNDSRGINVTIDRLRNCIRAMHNDESWAM